METMYKITNNRREIISFYDLQGNHCPLETGRSVILNKRPIEMNGIVVEVLNEGKKLKKAKEDVDKEEVKPEIKTIEPLEGKKEVREIKTIEPIKEEDE